ncbi:MAG: uroporphyrinogen-III synthase [Ignavibacteriaceae bacterium]
MLTVLENNKENKKSLKRKRILEAASGLFSRKKYHEVMVDEVAKLASIAKGTVYNYFSSKEDLYFSIMKMRMEKLNASLREKIKSDMSSLYSLRSFIIHLYMFMMKYNNFFLMYRKESLEEENEFCTELVSMEKDLRNILRGIISTGKNEAIFRNIEEDFAIDLILGSIYAAVERGIESRYTEEKQLNEREKIFDFVLHGLFAGFDDRSILPLKNKTIVITRTVEQSKESAEVFRELGADVIIFPTLDIVPPKSWEQFDEVVKEFEKISFIIFTSAHAVNMFSRRCEELEIRIDYSKLKIVAVGNKTAAVCEKHKIPVDIIPSKFSGEGVINVLSSYNLKDKLIFIPRSVIGRDELPKGLQERGAVIKTVPVYNVTLPSEESIRPSLEKLSKKKPDLFIFTSPSTFENFLQIANIANPVKYFMGYSVAAIGPTTRTAIENRNVHVNIMPSEYTIEGLTKVIIEYYKK